MNKLIPLVICLFVFGQTDLLSQTLRPIVIATSCNGCDDTTPGLAEGCARYSPENTYDIVITEEAKKGDNRQVDDENDETRIINVPNFGEPFGLRHYLLFSYKAIENYTSELSLQLMFDDEVVELFGFTEEIDSANNDCPQYYVYSICFYIGNMCDRACPKVLVCPFYDGSQLTSSSTYLGSDETVLDLSCGDGENADVDLCYEESYISYCNSEDCLLERRNIQTDSESRNINLESIEVYPNPFEEELTILNLNEGDQVYLVDILGQVIYNFQSMNNNRSHVIDASGFYKGIYFMSVIRDEEIIKQSKFSKF